MQSIPENGPILLDFDPYDGVVNQELFIRLENLSNTNQNLGVAVSNPGEYRGSFLVNGELVEKDAIFQYRCVR